MRARRHLARLRGAAVLVAVLVAALAATIDATAARATAPEPPPELTLRRVETTASGNSLGADASARTAGAERTPGGAVAPAPVVRLTDTLRAEACGALSAAEGYRWPCADDRVVDHSDVCGDLPVLLPLWERTRTSERAPWSGWTMVEDLTCGGRALPTPELVLTEFRRLPITPSALVVQPVGPVLVNIDTIAYVEPVTQVLTTTVLGLPVTFTATAAGYVWDFGEGEPFATTSPGHPYPDQDVAHPYARPGTGQITVTTTWQATYTLGDDPTVRTVPGTATTSTTSAAFEIVEVHSRLVAEP